jgi:hypothetical protein
MKLRIFAIIVALLAGVTFSRADIIGNTIADDHDGVIVCNTYGFQTIAPHEFSLNIDGQHMIRATGDLLGTIYTDTPQDPKLTLFHSIDNDTGFTWTDYHAVICLDKTFTIDNISAGGLGDAGGDWTWAVTQPTLVGGLYVGEVDYFAGTAIPSAADPDNPLPGNTLDFGYRLTFAGTVAFAEHLTPSPVPEPGTLALLLCGLGAVAVRRRFTF